MRIEEVSGEGARLAIAYGDGLPEADPSVSLAKALVAASERFPDGKFAYVGSGSDPVFTSYARTLERARRIAQGLRRRGIGPGDKLILYCRRGWNFIPAIWASFLTGAIPVAIARDDSNRHQLRTLTAVMDRIRAVLDSPHLVADDLDETALRRLRFDSVHASALSMLEAEEPAEVAHDAAPDDLALLVLTSGTTEQPNLVSLSARAVLARWWPVLPVHEEATGFLSCWPFDHVMGMGLASPNLPLKAYLPTDRFVQSPTLWLDAIDRLPVTHATMTNFGMALIARGVAAAPDRTWDLGRLRKIGVGGEAIDKDTCRRFCDALRPFGLRPDAVILGYGLSECGPVVGGSRHFSFEEADEAKSFIALDRPTRGHAVRVMHEDDTPCVEGEIGGVEVKGPTMASGYFGDPEAAASLFTPDGWLRTGDLGFLRDGCLTVTGRVKETIIVNAQKYACAEIEAAALSIGGIDAAFAVACDDLFRQELPNGHARFAVFVVAPTVAPDGFADLARRLRLAIRKEFGFAPAYVVPIADDEVPRTQLGKVQRLELARRLRDGGFDDRLAPIGPLIPGAATARQADFATEAERLVSAMFATHLGHDDFGLDQDFFELGGDSLAANSLVHDVEATFGRPLPEELLHDRTSVRRLAAHFGGDVGGDGVIPPGRTAAKARPRRGAGDRLAPEVETRLRKLTAKWAGERVGGDGLMRGLNWGGTKRPIFCCLQSDREFRLLAEHLGPDQPVYAMRSGHIVMNYRNRGIALLARRYIEDLLTVDNTGPYVIAGVCQGGIVAIEMARQIQGSGRDVQLLLVLDASLPGLVKRQPYEGRVALFVSRRSRFSPYRQFRSPEAGWRKLAPAGVQLEVLECDHLGVFTPQMMPDLAEKFRSVLSWASGPPAPRPGVVGGLPKSAYSAGLVVPRRLKLAPAQRFAIDVEVTNSGSSHWAPTNESGIALGNHWLRRDGEIHIWADGRVGLADGVAPGGTVTLSLSMTAPAEPGEYLLEIDLVEEGVTWFKDRGSHCAFIEIEIARHGLAGQAALSLRRLVAGR